MMLKREPPSNFSFYVHYLPEQVYFAIRASEDLYFVMWKDEHGRTHLEAYRLDRVRDLLRERKWIIEEAAS